MKSVLPRRSITAAPASETALDFGRHDGMVGEFEHGAPDAVKLTDFGLAKWSLPKTRSPTKSSQFTGVSKSRESS